MQNPSQDLALEISRPSKHLNTTENINHIFSKIGHAAGRSFSISPAVQGRLYYPYKSLNRWDHAHRFKHPLLDLFILSQMSRFRSLYNCTGIPMQNRISEIQHDNSRTIMTNSELQTFFTCPPHTNWYQNQAGRK